MRSRPHFAPHRAVLTAATLALGPAASAGAADCMGMRGGELVLSASDRCLSQMRDPALRRRLVQVIDGGTVGAAAPAAATAPTGRSPTGARANLAHPLARLSQINAQSRYLWSLGNPSPTYYGQKQAP